MRAWACLRVLCGVLKENRPNHECDANFIFLLVLFRLAWVAFRCHQQQTEDNIQEHIVHGVLVVYEASNHCITTVTKMQYEK
jgi:hypothetical protein